MALPILSHFYRRRADATAGGERGLVRAKYLEASLGVVDEFAVQAARNHSVPEDSLVSGEFDACSTSSAVEARDSGAVDVGPNVLEGPEIEDAPDSFETYSSGTYRTVRG